MIFCGAPAYPCIPNSNPPANSKMTQHSTAHSTQQQTRHTAADQQHSSRHQHSMSFNIGSEPDGLEGRAALMLLVTTTQPSSKHSRGAVKPKIHIQTYIRTSAYVERTTKLDPEPPGMGQHSYTRNPRGCARSVPPR